MRKLYLIIVCCLVILSACNSTEPNKTSNQSIQLTFVDAASIEAWVEINLENVPLPAKLSFNKNNKYAFELNITSNDTIICLDSLSPQNNYSVQAATNEQKSNLLQFTTLDTTSHDITWINYEFGDGSYNILNSIIIFDDGKIIAVGDVHKDDDYEVYNLVEVVNGDLELKKKYFYGTGYTTLSEKASIHYFNNEDYIVCGTAPILRKDNKEYFWEFDSTVFHSWIYSIAGLSNNSIYIGGSNGNLAYYNGQNWQKLDSKTDLFVSDLIAYKNYKADKAEIIGVACNEDINSSGRTILIKINNLTNVEITDLQLGKNFYNIWTNRGFPIYIASDKVYSNKSGRWTEIPIPNAEIKSRIVANGLNDVIAAGSGEIAHYNGSTWKVYPADDMIRYRDVAINGNIIALCGRRGLKAFITIGIRR